ncbi:MAG: RNA polymerase sigma factor [Alphaproteobacteria bacterium]|nr:MAG: RNA polymerase sigma factor [Alphaproteobacteria bacterium]
MTHDDASLAARAQAGDREAFRLLLERHYDTAYRIAFRFTRCVEDAEDIAQEVCLSLARRLASFRGRSRFTTWFYTVVLNACRDHARKQKSTLALQANYAVYREQEMADAADNDSRAQWLDAALLSLEPKLRETAVLVLGEALSHREAAEILGCSESTVSWRMHELRKKLKQLLKEEHD